MGNGAMTSCTVSLQLSGPVSSYVIGATNLGRTLDQTVRVGYVHEGTLREERGRSQPRESVDVGSLIYSIQHHDFVGNHPLGKRLHQLTSQETQRAASTLLLLHPATPMLFMGEEFCCDNPFQFFVDFGDKGFA